MTEPLTLAREIVKIACGPQVRILAEAVISLSDANKALTAKLEAETESHEKTQAAAHVWIKRATAAEATLAKVEAIEAELHDTVRYLKTERDDAVRWRASAVACADRLEAKLAEALDALHPFDKYVPDACFEGKGRYKLVETTQAGGGWLGAEDFRRARSFLASKEASHAE